MNSTPLFVLFYSDAACTKRILFQQAKLLPPGTQFWRRVNGGPPQLCIAGQALPPLPQSTGKQIAKNALAAKFAKAKEKAESAKTARAQGKIPPARKKGEPPVAKK